MLETILFGFGFTIVFCVIVVIVSYFISRIE